MNMANIGSIMRWLKFFCHIFPSIFWLFFAPNWPTVIVCTYIVCLWKQKLCMMITLPDRVVSSWYLGPSLMSKISCKYCHFIFFLCSYDTLFFACFQTISLLTSFFVLLTADGFFLCVFKDFSEEKSVNTTTSTLVIQVRNSKN